MDTVRPYQIEGAELRGATLTNGAGCYASAKIDVAFTIRNTATASPIAAPRLTIESEGQLTMKILPILPPNGVVTVEMNDVPFAPPFPPGQCPDGGSRFNAWPVIVGAVVDRTALEVVATFPKDGTPTLSLVNHTVTSEPETPPSSCPAGTSGMTCWETTGPCVPGYGCAGQIPNTYCLAPGEGCPP